VGVPDDDMGQIVHAVVQLRSGSEATEDELRAHMGERLVRYKVPRTWEFVDAPVRDDAGKVRRSALAARAAE
jgi:bile acid-coenzyme A ligase